MSNKIETFQVLFMKRNARKRGPTSSEQQNDLVEETAHDLTELNLQWNERLVPLLDSLPNGTEGSPSLAVDAFANGLDGKTMFTDSDATVSTETQYWNTAASRPRTLKEQITDVYTQMTLLREELEGQIGATVLTAAQISIEDDAALFVANNVEDALVEAVAKANLALQSVIDFSSIEEHILPALDDTLDLGSSSFRWRDLYLGPASLNIVAKTTDPGYSSNKTFTIEIDPITESLTFMDGATPLLELNADTGASFPAGSSGDIIPAASGINHLGSINAPWDNLYLEDALFSFQTSGITPPVNWGNVYGRASDSSLRYRTSSGKEVSMDAGDISTYRHAHGSSSLNIFYVPWATGSSWSTGSITANQLIAIPFVIGNEDRTVSEMQINVITGSAGNAIFGIYTNKGNKDLYPDQLVASSTTVSTSTTGIKTATITAVLKAGQLYWGVWNGSATPVIRVPGTGSSYNILGHDPNQTTSWGRIQVARTYDGALPTTFLAGATLQATFTPGIYYKFTSA